MNSKLGSFYFAKTCAGLEGKTETYLRFFGQHMERFPVRRVDLSNASDKAMHDCLVRLVETMLALHGQLSAAPSVGQKEIVQRQIDATDAQIDRLVYDLCGLTTEEIATVERER